MLTDYLLFVFAKSQMTGLQMRPGHGMMKLGCPVGADRREYGHCEIT